ncbi:MAG: hypothetical protein LIO96_13855 [Lachnospiraceae bacterium]|nr:hypothetical protein [Lachnospiraceae bacterium]
MADMDRELGWDDTIQKDDNEFEPVPEGDYEFTVEKYERARSSGQGKLPPCNMAVVYFRVKGPDGQEVSIRENFILIRRWSGNCHSSSGASG